MRQSGSAPGSESSMKVAVSVVKILDSGAVVEEVIRGEIEWGVTVMDGSSPA